MKQSKGDISETFGDIIRGLADGVPAGISKVSLKESLKNFLMESLEKLLLEKKYFEGIKEKGSVSEGITRGVSKSVT